MSFSGTPLGQGRRLDQRTFLNKSNPNVVLPILPPVTVRPTNSPPKADRSIPTSYAYGAPTQGTRSPPKPLSASSSHSNRTESHITEPDNSQDEPALVRFARLKQRSSANNPPNPADTTASQPNPTKWSVKDTSVQIANAFQQAALHPDDMAHPNPNTSNDSWASGSRSLTNIPRSTSVEYEKETQSTSTRRLPAPPSRHAPPPARSATARRTLEKGASLKFVPDSEEEDAREQPQTSRERGKSPFESVIDVAKRTAFYLRPRSQEPEDRSNGHVNVNGNGNGSSHHHEASYDYANEERDFLAQDSPPGRPAARKANNVHKRNRMSQDAKAYRPSASDLEYSDEDLSDDGQKRRRKKGRKKDMTGGPLSTLPVTSYDKRRKKRRSKADGGEEEEEEESGSEEKVSEQGPIYAAQRLSVPRELRPSSRTQSIPPPPRAPSVRGSVPPEPQQLGDTSFDSVEEGLHSIPEQEEPEFVEDDDGTGYSRSRSCGGILGRFVHIMYRVVIITISSLFRSLGRLLGSIVDMLFSQPTRWISQANLTPLFKLLLVGAIVYGTFVALRNADFPSLIPVLSSGRAPYQAPDIPASSIAEISARLQALENALAGLSLDSQQSRVRIDSNARAQNDVVVRLGTLETQLQQEAVRAADDRKVDRVSASQGLAAVRSEVETLRELVNTAQSSPESSRNTTASDEEARARLAALEERIGTVEGGVREALEMGKHSVKTGGSGPAWWTKIAGGSKSALTIKSSDGQDVTELIGHLVDSAVSLREKDTLAKADFALHSGGAAIIPSLTSPTLEIRPQGVRATLVGLVTGNGYAIGRPPITALHHETHNGHCWPFAGGEGQLGVALAHPVFIEEVTIDHVAREVAWDMKSAPRKMELWGLVEGAENMRRVLEWEASQEEGGKEGGEEEEPYPRTLPRSAKYVRIASFEYDIAAQDHVQTFPVAQDVRELGVDFGVVVLRVASNWGREFTCLYRMRVHGRRLEEGGAPEEQVGA
ncbi:hypothetical protein OF83DRAFT_1128946 [Amylostereum chailletii]|nr:hypothetical protein OF83DRAFT_1128946 [Amylostereum chailletii]